MPDTARVIVRRLGAAAAGLPVGAHVSRRPSDRLADDASTCCVPGCSGVGVVSPATDGGGPWYCRAHAGLA
jgi:hypothetical protein